MYTPLSHTPASSPILCDHGSKLSIRIPVIGSTNHAAATKARPFGMRAASVMPMSTVVNPTMPCSEPSSVVCRTVNPKETVMSDCWFPSEFWISKKDAKAMNSHVLGSRKASNILRVQPQVNNGSDRERKGRTAPS